MRTPELRMLESVTRFRAREVQLVTEVSTTHNQETELQGRLLNLHQEIARINALFSTKFRLQTVR